MRAALRVAVGGALALLCLSFNVVRPSAAQRGAVRSLVAVRTATSGTAPATPAPLTAATAAPLTAATSPPPTTAACAPLTGERVHAAAASNPIGLVVVTFANGALSDFARNWLAHLDKTAVRDAALIGATDAEAKAALASSGRCFALESALGAGEAKWGSPGFSHMGRTKAALTEQLVLLNVTLLLADADVVFVRDPLPWIAARLHDGADILFHTDAFASAASQRALGGGGGSGPTSVDAAILDAIDEPRVSFGSELNTGLFVLTPRAAPLASEWVEAVGRPGAFENWKNDQQAFNELLRRYVTSRDGADHLIRLRVGATTLRLGLMPAQLFPSGHVFFLQRMPYKLGATPIAVHLTYQNCDAAGKRSRMREAGLWALDPPAHLSPKGGLLTYTNHLPDELTSGFAPLSRDLRPDDELVARHFRLMYHQIGQFRTALTLAIATNRTLVLPRFLCGLESVTNFAHRGVRCSGCAMDLPYWCPADHVLRVHYLEGSMPQKPRMRLPIAEHSLLAKRRGGMAADAIEVRLAGVEDAESCSRAVCSDSGAYIRFAEGVVASTDGAPPAVRRHDEPVPLASVVEQLRQFAAVEHLHVRSQLSPPRVAPRLEAGMQRALDATLLYLGGGFCCVHNPGGKGHFWYDLFFDAEAHTDRWGRRWGKGRPWRPEPGP